MITLYKKTDNKIFVWSAMEISRYKGIMINAIVGEPEGDPEEVTANLFSSFARETEKKVEKLKAQGYTEDAPEDYVLVILYPYDLKKQQQEELQESLDLCLGNLNLGLTDEPCPENSIYCLVYDYELALKHVKEHLATTPFNNYSEIYNLDDVEDDKDEEDYNEDIL